MATSAVSAGLLVAAVTLLGAANSPMTIVLSLLDSGAMFVTAAAPTVLAAKPTDFYHRGYSPELLAPRDRDELQIVKWAVEDLATLIRHNGMVLERAARLRNGAISRLRQGWRCR